MKTPIATKSKITIDDFDIPEEDSHYSNNFSYDKILQLSVDQTAYAYQHETKKIEEPNLELNKYFSINIHELCKSLQCVSFNELVNPNDQPKYFTKEQLKRFKEEAADSVINYELMLERTYAKVDHAQIFQDLMIGSNSTKVKIDEPAKPVAIQSENMDDWLDDLLN